MVSNIILKDMEGTVYVTLCFYSDASLTVGKQYNTEAVFSVSVEIIFVETIFKEINGK